MFYLSLIYILCLSLLYILSFVWCSVYLLFHIVFLIWFRDCFSLVTSIICHRYTCMCFTLILCTVCHWFHVLFVIGIMYSLSLVSHSVCHWFHLVFVIGFMWCVSLICVACLSLVSCGVWNWFMFWWFVICFRKCMSLASYGVCLWFQGQFVIGLMYCVNACFQILEKVYMQLQTFLDDPVYREEHMLHLELVSTFARVGPNAEPKFRDECKWKTFF